METTRNISPQIAHGVSSDHYTASDTPRGAIRMVELEFSPQDAAVLDSRQDDLMASESANGRPPSHEQRRTGWRWVAVGFSVLGIGMVTGALIAGVSLGAVIGFGLGAVIILLLAGWPMWAAGLSRGGDEKIARREAIDEHRQRQRQ